MFVSGFQKCGTTSLHEILATHPEVRSWRSELFLEKPWRSKEPHFFNKPGERDIAYYQSCFHPGGRVRLDSTPNYIVSENGQCVRDILHHFPQARFIILLRDPLQRAFSAWNHWCELSPQARWDLPNDPRSFHRSILNEFHNVPRKASASPLVATGYYAEWLKLMFSHCPKEQALILFSDDLKYNFDETMQKVTEFIGLTDHTWMPLYYHVRNAEGWQPDKNSTALLKEIYRPHDDALEALLDCPLPWRAPRPQRPSSAVFTLSPAPQPPREKSIRMVVHYPGAHDDLEGTHVSRPLKLADSLKAQGHSVSVLAAHFNDPPSAEWLEKFEGYEVDILPSIPPVMIKGGIWEVVLSTAICVQLIGEKWDAVLLPGNAGLAYQLLQRLNQGHHPSPCLAFLYFHQTPSVRFARENKFFIHKPDRIQTNWLEMRCVELSECSIFPEDEDVNFILELVKKPLEGKGRRRMNCYSFEESSFQKWLDVWNRQHRANFCRCDGLADNVEPPKISVCMATWNRQGELERTINAFLDQTWPNLELVVVNDGSHEPAALAMHEKLKPLFQEKDWLWIDQANAGPGAARTTAARHARGELLLFADDDNFPMPHHVMSLAITLLVGKHDIALAHMVKFVPPDLPGDILEGTQWWMPTGGDLATGAFTNVFGETSMLMHKETFFTVGGFSLDNYAGAAVEEDRLLLTKAVLQGLSIAHFPEPTYWYADKPGARHNEYSLHSWSCQVAVADLYANELDPRLRHVFEFVAGSWDPAKLRLREISDSKMLAKLSKENSRLRDTLSRLWSVSHSILQSRRWRLVNLPRLLTATKRTYKPLEAELDRVAIKLSLDGQTPPVQGDVKGSGSQKTL